MTYNPKPKITLVRKAALALENDAASIYDHVFGPPVFAHALAMWLSGTAERQQETQGESSERQKRNLNDAYKVAIAVLEELDDREREDIFYD